MIADIFILFLYGILKTFFAVLPPMSALPDQWEAMWVWFAGGISNWMYLMPAPEVLATVPLAIIAFEVAYWSFYLFMVIYKMLRG